VSAGAPEGLGPKHPKYIARVLGEFPSDDPSSVFPLSWIERAGREPTEAELIRGGRYGRRPLGTTVVDIVGIAYNFALYLVDNGFPCFGFNVGARAIDNTQFANQKAEAHWMVRRYLQDNLISGLTDEETRSAVLNDGNSYRYLWISPHAILRSV
jgi:hypothetical protein